MILLLLLLLFMSNNLSRNWNNQWLNVKQRIWLHHKVNNQCLWKNYEVNYQIKRLVLSSFLLFWLEISITLSIILLSLWFLSFSLSSFSNLSVRNLSVDDIFVFFQHLSDSFFTDFYFLFVFFYSCSSILPYISLLFHDLLQINCIV